MRTIINDHSGLPYSEVMSEIVRIAKKGYVTTGSNGPSYKARTIFNECVITCVRNGGDSFTFTVKRM